MDADRAIAAIAERQHGLITLDQALLAGLTRAGVKHRVGTGRWERLHPGVYRMAGSARTFEQEVLAACRAAGPGATASHRSAASLLDLPGLTRKTELTVVCEHVVRLKGVTIHRSVRLDRADRFWVKGIPVTTPYRTLIDLASSVPKGQLELLLDHTLATRLVNLSYLKRRLGLLGTRGRKGVGYLVDLIAARPEVARQPQSGFQRRVRKALVAAGLPEPELEYPVQLPSGRMAYLDAAYVGPRLAIEADSYRHHSSRTDWSRDRTRNSELVALGWGVLPVTYHDLEVNPAAFVDKVRRRLDLWHPGAVERP